MICPSNWHLQKVPFNSAKSPQKLASPFSETLSHRPVTRKHTRHVPDALTAGHNKNNFKPCGNGLNIVGRYMLRLFAQPVACCCMLLEVVSQSLKLVKLRVNGRNNSQHCWPLLHIAGPVSNFAEQLLTTRNNF